MAETKKTEAAVKAAVKPAAEVKAAPVVKAEEKKAETKAAPAKKAAVKKAAPVKKAEPKKETVKAEEKKVETKAAPVKKAAAKKETEAKKPAAKKAVKEDAVKANIVLQYGDKNVTYDTIVENSKNNYQYEMGGNVDEIKKLSVYVKPEENAAYYVVNDKVQGRIGL